MIYTQFNKFIWICIFFVQFLVCHGCQCVFSLLYRPFWSVYWFSRWALMLFHTAHPASSTSTSITAFRPLAQTPSPLFILFRSRSFFRLSSRSRASCTLTHNFNNTNIFVFLHADIWCRCFLFTQSNRIPLILYPQIAFLHHFKFITYLLSACVLFFPIHSSAAALFVSFLSRFFSFCFGVWSKCVCVCVCMKFPSLQHPDQFMLSIN